MLTTSVCSVKCINLYLSQNYKTPNHLYNFSSFSFHVEYQGSDKLGQEPCFST